MNKRWNKKQPPPAPPLEPDSETVVICKAEHLTQVIAKFQRMHRPHSISKGNGPDEWIVRAACEVDGDGIPQRRESDSEQVFGYGPRSRPLLW